MVPVVEMSNIRKEFPGILANDNINIQLYQGEILALLGENGAGKSTLMSILFGLYQPDSGQIKVDGKEVSIHNPNDANALGIGMVHQHFKLVQDFTVSQNIILGRETSNFGFLDMKKARKKVKELSELYGLNVDPDARVENISVGMQQRVEILKMLYRDARILVFDEPSAVLTPQEILELMDILRRLQKEGKSIILITHKLKEIKAIAERCTIIRKGKVVDTLKVSEASEAEMAEKMVGRIVNFRPSKKELEAGEEVLRFENVSVRNQRKVLGLQDVSFSVRRGEIFGVAGVEGNGQNELVEALCGLARLEKGQIFLKGSDITTDSIRKRFEAGISHIPEDRQKRGLVLDFSLDENLALQNYYHEPYSSKGFLHFDAFREHSESLIKAFDVRSGRGGASLARTLSGGNQQKAIVAREIENHPELLVAVQPTRGLDVGSIEYIHKRLLEQREQGKAVLLVSLELDEILSLSDRIGILSCGKMVSILDAKKADEFQLGRLMAGLGRENEDQENK